MGKIVILLIGLSLFLFAESDDGLSSSLERNCLSCHKDEQIPDRLIHGRYLVKYSTNEKMEEVIFNYLKEPNKQSSIMPSAFFLKFPMCDKTPLNDNTLRKNIKEYLDYFDVKKKFVLEEEW